MLNTPLRRFRYIIDELIRDGRMRSKSAVARAIGIEPTNLPKYTEEDGRELNPAMLRELARLGYSINWYFLGGPLEERFISPDRQARERTEAERQAIREIEQGAQNVLRWVATLKNTEQSTNE